MCLREAWLSLPLLHGRSSWHVGWVLGPPASRRPHGGLLRRTRKRGWTLLPSPTATLGLLTVLGRRRQSQVQAEPGVPRQQPGGLGPPSPTQPLCSPFGSQHCPRSSGRGGRYHCCYMGPGDRVCGGHICRAPQFKERGVSAVTGPPMGEPRELVSRGMTAHPSALFTTDILHCSPGRPSEQGGLCGRGPSGSCRHPHTGPYPGSGERQLPHTAASIFGGQGFSDGL